MNLTPENLAIALFESVGMSDLKEVCDECLFFFLFLLIRLAFLFLVELIKEGQLF